MASVYINTLLQACLEVASALFVEIHASRRTHYQFCSNFFTQTNMVLRDGTRPCRPTLKDTQHLCHTHLGVVINTNTGNTLLHVPKLHCDWPYEMASSPLPFTFLPTTTSYRAGAIFKFEMCHSAPRHSVF